MSFQADSVHQIKNRINETNPHLEMSPRNCKKKKIKYKEKNLKGSPREKILSYKEITPELTKVFSLINKTCQKTRK